MIPTLEDIKEAVYEYCKWKIQASSGFNSTESYAEANRQVTIAGKKLLSYVEALYARIPASTGSPIAATVTVFSPAKHEGELGWIALAEWDQERQAYRTLDRMYGDPVEEKTPVAWADSAGIHELEAGLRILVSVSSVETEIFTHPLMRGSK